MPLDNSTPDVQAPYEQMGATLLAQQPPAAPARETEWGADWGDIFGHLEGRLSALRSWRYSWWLSWATLAEYIIPRRYHWLITANKMTKGFLLNRAIVDGTATLAMQICAAGLWTGLTSPSRPWFKLEPALPWVELDADGKAWIEDCETRVYAVLAQSNFYNIFAQMFQDVAVFGTAPVIIYEDEESVIRCYLPCAGEYFLASGARLSVDTLYREFTLTVSGIVEMFKLENCPPDVAMLWQQGGGALETEFVVAHAIEPNFELQSRSGGAPVKVVPGCFTWRELYWLRGQQNYHELSRRGFNERPFVVARWSVVSNDAYGRSPGMDAIGDTQQLQQETRRKGEFIDKLVRPPMGADPRLKNEPSSIIPGNITYTDTSNGNKGFWPLFQMAPQALAPMVADIEKIEERINRCFFVDIFMAISRMEGVQPRNELELTKRDLERLQVLGPFINLFETEVAGPSIERVMAILRRRRMLKPQPASMRGVPLKISYISIMKIAQTGAEAVGLKDFAVTGAAAAQAAQTSGLPNPLRIVNWDKWYRRFAASTNTPIDILYTDDEVKKSDIAHAQLLKQQQAISTGQAGVQAAQALGNTPIGPGTALGAILGHGGGAPINTSGGGQ